MTAGTRTRPPHPARPRTPHGSQPRPRPVRPAPGARTGGRPAGRRPAGHRPPPRQPRVLRLGDGQRRLRAAVVLLLFVLSLFAARLVQLQGLDATTYAAEAEQGRLRTVSLPAVRGTITDRNGVALATTVDAVNITADQDIIARYSDPAATARVLAPVLDMDASVLQERLTGEAKFVYVAKKVAPKTWREVRELDHPDEKIEGLPGIFGEKTSRRVYPAGKVAANVVGYVGADNKGLGGLEYAMDDVLAGRDGTATYELSAGGRRIPSGVDTERDAVPGRDVRLTIDRDIQFVAQKAIAKAVADTRSESGTVIVLDPRNGDLLAMATAPTFDANHPGEAPAADRGNRPLTEPYEPGSTGKVLTASALLEEGVITPKTPIVVPNRLTRADKTFKDFEDHPVQHLTYAGTIAKSSNIGTIRSAERLGNLKRMYPYLKKFGIGQPTGLGLPGEASGYMLKPRDWSATTGYTTTFGQGYSVNTVQMASAIGTVANEGVRVSPRLVASTTDPTGQVHRTAEGTRTRVVSAKTAETVRLMMETVTNDGGTAPLAHIPGYRVGGKTGTAQRFNTACGCYSGYTMSFIGLAPVDDPQLVVAVTLQAPRSALGGGVNAGPVFKQVASFALETLRIPPTGTKRPHIKLTTNGSD
ncbi:MAG TPA: penicillin-binding protein 2 [Actinomycetes bacterium]|nr:penicillin-binding protein 2 [Actinomycetes bacterium]